MADCTPNQIQQQPMETDNDEMGGLAGWTVFLGATVLPAYSASATGEWLVADKSARIMIHACGNHLRGVIAWERVHGLDEQKSGPDEAPSSDLGAADPDQYAIYGACFMGRPHLQRRQREDIRHQNHIALVKCPAGGGLCDGISVWGRNLDEGQRARRRLCDDLIRALAGKRPISSV
jgi:hypothetical protein